MKKIILIAIVALSVLNCTDAQRSKMFSIGDSAHVKCFSGGIIIYEGYSTGKISSEQDSDGYYFRDKETNLLMEVSGNCVITYK